MRITDHERFRNIAAGVQGFTIAIAAVVGGIWAAYTFGAMRSSAIATANLERAVAANRAQPILSVLIRADSTREDLNGEKILHIRVTLSNQGDTFIVLKLPPNTLRVARIRALARDSATPVLEPPVSGSVFDLDPAGLYPRVSQEVPPHGDRHLHYLVRVPKPGLYMVSFEANGTLEMEALALANIPEQELAGSLVAAEMGITLRPRAWAATTLVAVR